MEDNNDVKYNLTDKKIIPLNAPIGFANTTPPTTLPFQAVEKGQSISEGLCAGQGIPYYNEDGTVNPNAVATTLKMMLDMYNTISQPVALLSMGATPEWDQSVRDNNGGYPKGFIVKTYEDSNWIFWVSIINNNMEDKPLLLNHNHDRWNWVYMIDNFGQIIFNYNIQVFNHESTSPTKDNYARLYYNYLGFFDKNNNLVADYSSAGAKAAKFSDNGGTLGSSDNGNPEYTYLGGGNVIIQGVVQSTNGRFSVTLPDAIQANVGGHFPPVFGEPMFSGGGDPTLMQSVQVDIGMENNRTIVGLISKFVNGSPVPLNVTVGYFLKAKLV